MESIVVLMVEDNQDHALIIQRGLTAQNFAVRIQMAQDGQEALDYLLRQGTFSGPPNAPRPDLVLLDLKLPKVDGLQVLRRIKSDPQLRSIPVVVLTSSEQEIDMANSYLEGANSYIVKPLAYSEFVNTVAQMNEYWVGVNSLPPLPRPAQGAV